MVSTVKDIKEICEEDYRRILTREILVVDANPTPALATGFVDCKDYLTVNLLIYADDTTGAGKVASFTVWRYRRRLADDPLGVVLETRVWVKGESFTDISMAYAGSEHEFVIDTMGAEAIFVQCTAYPAALTWIRTDVYTGVTRKGAIPVYASGIADALRSVFKITPSGLKVDTELSIDSSTLKVDNLFNRTVLDDMATHTNWVAGNAEVVNKGNSTTHVWGTSSMTFDKIGGAATSAFCTKTLATAVNLSTYSPSDIITTHVYLSSVSNVVYAFFRLGTNVGNYAEWRVPVVNLTVGWNRLLFRLSDVTVQVGTGWNPASTTCEVVGVEMDLVGSALAGILWDEFAVAELLTSLDPNLERCADDLDALLLKPSGGAKLVLSTFDSHTAWTLFNGATTNKGNSLDHIWGTQAITFDKAADGAITVAAVDQTLGTSLNISTDFSMADILVASFYLSSLTDVTYVYVRLGTTNANYAEWRIPVANLVVGRNVFSKRFVDMDASVGNGWNPAAVAYLHVGVQFGLAATALAGIRWDQLYSYNSPNTVDPIAKSMLADLDALLLKPSGGAKLVISTFDSHLLWAAVNADTTNKGNSLNHVWGTNAITFDKVAGGGFSLAGVDQTLASNLNISTDFSMADILVSSVYVSDISNITYAYIRLGTTNAHYAEWRFPVSKMVVGRNVFSVRFSDIVANVGNGWNPAAVAYVQVGVQFNAVANTLAGILWDQLFAYNSPNTADPIIIQQAKDIASQSCVPATHWSPRDGSVAYTSGITLTCAGWSDTVADTNCLLISLYVKNATGNIQKYTNGSGGISLTSAANVITITGAGATPFLATDLAYYLFIVGQSKSFTATSNSMRVENINPDPDKYLRENLVETAAFPAGTVAGLYYPGGVATHTSGQSMDGYKDLSIEYQMTGGAGTTVTLTVEATNASDVLVVGDWIDITKACYDVGTHTYNNASFVTAAAGTLNGILDLDNANYRYVRIKIISSAGANSTLILDIRRKAM